MKGRDLDLPEATRLESMTGKGVRAQIQGATVLVGNHRFLEESNVEITSWAADILKLEKSIHPEH